MCHDDIQDTPVLVGAKLFLSFSETVKNIPQRADWAQDKAKRLFQESEYIHKVESGVWHPTL